MLGITNYLLQIFFIRLAYCRDIETNETWYSIMYWIIPFSGWNTDYIVIGKTIKYKRIKLF